MTPLTTIHPEGWPAGPGYSHAVVTTGPVLHVAAVAGVDPTSFEFDRSLDLLGQWRQALANLATLLAAAGASMADVASIRVYVADMAAYQGIAREVGRLHREVFGDHRPAATMLGVALAADEALVEIECVAQLPAPR